VAYAKGQGWLEKPAEAGEAPPEAQAEERAVRMPPPRPGAKPDAQDRPED
jgi:hypothetical protein